MPFANAVIFPEVSGEHIDVTLRRLAKALQKAGVFHDVRQHESFISRAQKRRSKSALARARLAKRGRHIPNE